jgi:O-antigen/teichoic acid export membrane protein
MSAYGQIQEIIAERLMLNDVKRVFFRGEFNRNVLTLMTGTGLGQVIPLAVTPILSRIYSPEEFGIFALVIAVASSLSVVATGRYELAIMLPRKDADAANIGALSIVINFGVSVVLFAIAWLANGPISEALGNPSISTWLYVVPLAVFLNGIYLNLTYWSNRKKLYFLMANRRVIQSGGMAAVQLGLGMLRAGAGGLVTGSICGQALAVGMMAKMVHGHSPQLWRSINRRKMWALAKRYKNCAQFLVPAHTLSAVAMQLPSIFINATFGLAAAGSFMLAERVVGSPLSLVSGSIADVFRQHISQSYLAGEHCRSEFLSALQKLTVIATPPFVILVFFAPALFALLFGEKWRLSGEYAQLLSPMFFLRFITNPLSVVAIIAQKNKYELLWQGALLACLGAAACMHYFIRLDAKTFLVIFMIIYCALDLLSLFANYKFACDGDVKGQGADAA